MAGNDIFTGISVATSGRSVPEGAVGDYRKCSTKSSSSCTSFDGVRSNTIRQLVGLKSLSGCAMVVTAGTEVYIAAARGEAIQR